MLSFVPLQVLIGVALSIGFVFGPLIGADFSVYARQHQEAFYTVPALFALSLAVIDVVFIYLFFKETLPPEKRVSFRIIVNFYAPAIKWQGGI